jgi:hypothetical protein
MASIQASAYQGIKHLVIQIMKGEIDEETFSINFLGDNTGDWCPVCSCPWHKSTSPDVRADL